MEYPIGLFKNNQFKKKESKKQSKITSLTNIKKVYTIEHIIQFLSKDRKIRTKTENRIIRDYLASKIDYFAKLNNPEDIMKLDLLSSVLNYENYSKDENIINFGEEGEKFYVLIEGLVGIFKPKYFQKAMKLNEYINYMQNVKNEQNGMLKYNRVIEKNKHFNLDMDLLFTLRPESFLMKREFLLFIEEEEKFGESKEPFSFGDIALIKKVKRNATIRALIDCKLVTIDKSDYNKIMRELEEKCLEKKLADFKSNYPLFQNWTFLQLIQLLDSFSKQSLTYGEYLYRQNDDSDSIYFIRSGSLEIYSYISFGWINDFFDYLITTTDSLVYFLKTRKYILKDRDLQDYYENKRSKAPQSPCKFNPLKVSKIITSNQTKDDFENIGKDHEEVLNPYNLFKVLVRKVTSFDVLGLEDSLELKKRFSFVKCTSPSCELDKINLYDFFKLLSLNHDNNNLDLLLGIIARKKSFLFKQLLNASKLKSRELGETFSFRCKQAIDKEKPSEETKLITMKLRDNEFFRYDTKSKEIKTKIFLQRYFSSSSSRKENMALSKKKSSPHILNYNNSIGRNQALDKETKRYGKKSEKTSHNLKIKSYLSSYSSFSQFNTLSKQITIEGKDEYLSHNNSKKRFKLKDKNTFEQTLTINSNIKTLKTNNSSMSPHTTIRYQRTESFVQPRGNLKPLNTNNGSLSPVFSFGKNKKELFLAKNFSQLFNRNRSKNKL